MKAYSRIFFLIVYFTFLLVIINLNSMQAETVKGNIKATRGIRNLETTVIYIDNIADKHFQPPQKHPVMDQTGKTFIPMVMPILVGTTVDFMNDDNMKHNIFSISAAADNFNLGTYGEGIVRSYTFRNLGKIVILCNIHTEMEGYIFVLENPFFTMADDKGNFIISGIPPGKYLLKIWHKDAIDEEMNITIPDTREVEVNIVLKKK